MCAFAPCLRLCNKNFDLIRLVIFLTDRNLLSPTELFLISAGLRVRLRKGLFCSQGLQHPHSLTPWPSGQGEAPCLSRSACSLPPGGIRQTDTGEMKDNLKPATPRLLWQVPVTMACRGLESHASPMTIRAELLLVGPCATATQPGEPVFGAAGHWTVACPLLWLSGLRRAVRSG